MDKWEGEVAVVTGASAGIGKSVAVKLAEHGMKVAALARREDRLQILAEQFKGKGSIKAYRCDVSKDSDIEKVFSQIEKDLGRVRVLVNNAGISLPTPITDFAIDKWRQMFDLNVFGMFTCIKQVVDAVKKHNDKKLIHIFNINSIAGHQTPSSSEIAVYSATKHCVTILSKSFLKQLPMEKLKNIKVTSLSPGVVDTEIFEKGGWKLMDINAISHLSPDEIADGLISALASPANVNIAELTIKPAGESL